MRRHFSPLIAPVLCLICLILAVQCKPYEPNVVVRVVNQKDPSQTITGAKVTLIQQALTEITDAEGLATMEVDLGRFILDRVEMSVRAKDQGFQDTSANILIGKDQQEAVVIALKPFNRLRYTPDALIIQANETFREIKITNDGIDSVKADYINDLDWISLTPLNGVIPPDAPRILRVSTNDTQQNCRIDGEIKVSWIDRGVTNTDRIPVTKFLKDDEPPFPSFTIKQNGAIVFNEVYINKEISFDANPSTDNCEAFAPLEFSWDFGDNNPTGFSPNHVTYQHTFNTLGTPKIKLWVRDAAGNVAEKPFDLNVILEPSPPVIDPSMSAVEGSSLLSVSLSARVLNFGATYESLTDYGFVYSTVTDMPTLSTSIQPVISFGAIGPLAQAQQQFVFDTIITGLLPRRYYFRAYAKNNGFPVVYSETFIFDVVLARFVPVGGSAGGQSQSQRGDDNINAPANQKPRSIITYTNFLMTEKEITNAQYAAFLNDGPIPPSVAGNYLALFINNPACKINWNGNGYQVISGEENKPAVTVTYEGAKAFCTFLQGRLPTEAEWEAAARANASGVYPQWSGTAIAPPVNHVIFNTTFPSQVGIKQPNGYGLFDMSGNVAEWCLDWHDNYSLQNLVNPQGPQSSPTGERVIRGGSFQDDQEGCTVSFRGRLNPLVQSPRVGFRVVRNY